MTKQSEILLEKIINYFENIPDSTVLPGGSAKIFVLKELKKFRPIHKLKVKYKKSRG